MALNIPIDTLLPQPDPAEGKYLRLAMELGFKEQGCPFEFGSVSWLSGMQEEEDDKQTLLGSPDGEVSKNGHRGQRSRGPPPIPSRPQRRGEKQFTNKGAVEADSTVNSL